MIDYRDRYGERLGGLINWLEKYTDFGQWNDKVKQEVIEKMDNAWLMNLAEVVNERNYYQRQVENTKEYRKNYNDLVDVLKRILRV
jgi:hypothetical protein